MTLNNMVVLNRGDSLELKLAPNSLGEYEKYNLTDQDAIYFGLMLPKQPFEDAIIRRKLTAKDLACLDTLMIEFKPEDTIDLLPGKYFYSIKLRLNHKEIDSKTGLPSGKTIDKVATLVNKTKFIII